MKATASCPSCGHVICESTETQAFAGKNWTSAFLSITTMDLSWSIDVKGAEIQFIPGVNEEYVDKRDGKRKVKQNAHRPRWKVAEVKAEAEAESSKDDKAEIAKILSKQRMSAADKARLVALMTK